MLWVGYKVNHFFCSQKLCLLLILFSCLFMLKSTSTTRRECGLNWKVCPKKKFFGKINFFSFLPSLSFESMLPETNNLFCLALSNYVQSKINCFIIFTSIFSNFLYTFLWPYIENIKLLCSIEKYRDRYYVNPLNPSLQFTLPMFVKVMSFSKEDFWANSCGQWGSP